MNRLDCKSWLIERNQVRQPIFRLHVCTFDVLIDGLVTGVLTNDGPVPVGPSMSNRCQGKMSIDYAKVSRLS